MPSSSDFAAASRLYNHSRSTTTISHTFAEYNTLITIYIIGPISLLFLFRVHRTLEDTTISQLRKKLVFMILVLVQYTTLVVVRFDTIKGPVHYIFTALTFFLILVYHFNVRSQYSENHSGIKADIYNLKQFVGCCSVVCMFVFCYLMLFYKDIRLNNALWTFACILEIFALLALGSLDMLDIYVLGLDIQGVADS